MMVPQAFLTFKFIPLFSFYPNSQTILKSSANQVIPRLACSDSLPKGIYAGKWRLGRHTFPKKGAIIKKKDIREAERPADSPVVYIHQLPFFSCPRQHQPLPPCFRGHPSPHFPVPALLFFLLPQNIRKYFPLLLILPSPHHSPDEQNVTSGLHPSSVQFQPLCLIYSLPITPTGFQRRWLACPSLALCLPSPHVPGDFLRPQLKA